MTLLRAPEKLTPAHDLTRFENGKHPELDIWLRERAMTSEGLSARTYVVTTRDEPLRVVGYYALATAMEQRSAMPNAKLKRNLPERVPLMLIGRLAADRGFQGLGLGGSLLVDALRRCLAVADIAGLRGVIVHAIDEDATAFYRKHGFLASPLGERVLVLPIETARAVLG